jgi:hypothetical protein
METPNINSGRDYANILIKTILENESAIPKSEQMPNELIDILSEEIYEFADQTWNEYIIGKRDVFMFTDIEMNILIDKAGEKYTSELLDGMVDKDLLEVSIDAEGEFLYGLTKKGKDITDQLFGDRDI